MEMKHEYHEGPEARQKYEREAEAQTKENQQRLAFAFAAPPAVSQYDVALPVPINSA